MWRWPGKYAIGHVKQMELQSRGQIRTISLKSAQTSQLCKTAKEHELGEIFARSVVLSYIKERPQTQSSLNNFFSRKHLNGECLRTCVYKFYEGYIYRRNKFNVDLFFLSKIATNEL